MVSSLFNVLIVTTAQAVNHDLTPTWLLTTTSRYSNALNVVCIIINLSLFIKQIYY